MIWQYITHTHQHRLVLIFAGWAMDYRPFEGLRRDGYDIAVVWDYRTLVPDLSFTTQYDEIVVIAWSYGVVPCAMATAAIDERVTRRIAVCGTLWPVDDNRGIPRAIYDGTLAALNERNLLKFYRRMCGSSAAFDAFMTKAPERGIEELSAELAIFGTIYPDDIPDVRWDKAIVADADAIIPTTNQICAWLSAGVDTELYAGHHLPDFQAILDRYAIDKEYAGRCFLNRRESYDGAAVVQAEMVERMVDMLSRNRVSLSDPTLEIGCGTGLLSRVLDIMCKDLTLWDIVGPSPLPHRHFEQCDAELAISTLDAASLGSIATASTVQWFNSPARFVAQCHRVLTAGGIMLMSTFLPGNLREMTKATGLELPPISADRWHDILEPYFEIVDSEEFEHTLYFDAPIDVFRHLRATGANSLGRATNIQPALAAYPLDGSGRAPLTYRPIIFLLRKK